MIGASLIGRDARTFLSHFPGLFVRSLALPFSANSNISQTEMGDNHNSFFSSSRAVLIDTGNFVYAVDMEGFLLSPMIVGKISSISYDRKNPLFWDIIVDPSFKVQSLERIFAVTMEPIKARSK